MLLYNFLYLLQFIFYFILIAVLLLFVGKVCVEPTKAICKCKKSLHGKIALVTGGNSGIGLETARDLARRGARVIIACRDDKKAQKAIDDIVRTTGNPNVEFMYLDLFNPTCIRKFADDFNKTFDRLDILVNNAGCFATKPRLAENGVELVMQVNYIGPFLLTDLLMSKLEHSKPSRIVIVSSKLHIIARLNVEDLAGVKTNSHLMRYANSKLCNILWARALAKRLPEGVTASSLHPGVVRTNIFKRLGYFSKILDVIISIMFKTPYEGAQTIIHLCVAPELEVSSGGYYAECKLSKCSKNARDDNLAEKVWVESMLLSEK